MKQRLYKKQRAPVGPASCRINWQVFDQNTSAREELIDFALGGSWSRLRDYVCDRDTVKEVNKLKRIGIRDARQRAKYYLRKAIGPQNSW